MNTLEKPPFPITFTSLKSFVSTALVFFSRIFEWYGSSTRWFGSGFKGLRIFCV